jgi:hypothetical protein
VTSSINDKRDAAAGNAVEVPPALLLHIIIHCVSVLLLDRDEECAMCVVMFQQLLLSCCKKHSPSIIDY